MTLPKITIVVGAIPAVVSNVLHRYIIGVILGLLFMLTYNRFMKHFRKTKLYEKLTGKGQLIKECLKSVIGRKK